jgi:hypothetical protein
VIESVEDAPISELLRKNERIADGVARYQNRPRELAADAHRVRSSPWPSSVLKEEAKAQIEQWAEAAMPDFDSMVEHHSPLTFPTMSLQSMVRGTETPALAFAEIADPRLLCWLLKEQLLAKVNAGLDEVADDKHALDQQQREQAEAQINMDYLAAERSEVACIWAAEAQGEVIDFRSTTTPMAVLGLRLVNQPRASSSGTSPEHAYDVVGVRR